MTLIDTILSMQKIATRVFIYASIAFGVLGLIMVLSGLEPGSNHTVLETIIGRLFLATIFIILPSFALSVAAKYLNGKF